MKFSARQLQKGMKWWPPFLGAGIRVKSLQDDFRDAVVELRLGRLNRNYVGTHFGGSLYAMTDPFFMIMLLYNLGDDYLVWDKSGSIEYVAPGRGTVSAHFHLSEKRLQGCLMGSNRFRVDMPRLLDFYRQGRLNLDDMVSARVPLEELNDACRALAAGEVARSVVVFE